MKTFFLSIGFSLLFFTSHAQLKNGIYTCDNDSYELLKKISDSQLKNGNIFLFTTTHQDLGWLDHIEACTINRDTLWLTPFIERLEKEPGFRMDIEQTSIVMEYLHRHPDKKEILDKYLKEGRICIGATYVQPYEDMYSGESLSRQFYLGNRWLKNTFDGYKTQSYFNVDVPGRTLQMPQIMKKAGVDNLVISRHKRGLFYWEAPDGSKVRTYSPGHYIYFYDVLKMEDSSAIKELGKESVDWYSKYNNIPGAKAVMPAMLNYEFIWDQKPVANCRPFTEKWNSITHIQNANGKKIKVGLPKFVHATADDFFSALDKSTSGLPSIKGERPDVWLYIHGPSHEQAITASRKGDILLPAAEKIASFNALVEGSFMHYPWKRLSEAWMSKIYPDHGWGGKNGDITDNSFLRKYEYALGEAGAVLNAELHALASQIRVNHAAGIPVVVFNTLSWQRNDPVKIPLQLKKGYAANLTVTDCRGNTLPGQLSNTVFHDDGSIASATLCFVAKDAPPLGYTTFYLNPDKTPKTTSAGLQGDTFENAFYKLTFASGGIRQIEDRELGIALLDTENFLGGEVVTMKSEGNGAGGFDAIQQPSMEGFDKVSSHFPRWNIKENGDVYTSFSYRSPIRHAVVEQTVTVYHQVKKIDFDIAILNWEGILYREYRMMLPVRAGGGKVSYEVPYGVVRIGEDEMPGAAGERYNVPNSEQHPRSISNWINVSGEHFGVTLSSSVAVVDYIDPVGNSSSNPVIQPVLLASRKSCHWEGNEYLQYGDHFFHFSLSSHPVEQTQTFRFGTGSNAILQAVFAPNTYATANLPVSGSFFDIGNENVVVSAIKKCEDDDNLIVRLYNLSPHQQELHPVFYKKPKRIVKTNLIEEEMETVTQMVLDKYAIETYKLIYE
jgi:alpha-mannosidase